MDTRIRIVEVRIIEVQFLIIKANWLCHPCSGKVPLPIYLTSLGMQPWSHDWWRPPPPILWTSPGGSDHVMDDVTPHPPPPHLRVTFTRNCFPFLRVHTPPSILLTNCFLVRVRKRQIFHLCWQMNKMLWNGRTNKWNNTKIKKDLAMMVTYLPMKFYFDWTNRFLVRVRKRQMFVTMLTNEQNAKRTNERTE